MLLKRKLVGSGMSSGMVNALADIADGLIATGTTQADALELWNAINRFSTVASGTGAKLPKNAEPGDEVLVYNDGANPLLVYPITGQSIDDNSANEAVTVPTGSEARFTKHKDLLWSMQSNTAADSSFTPSGTGGTTQSAQTKLRKIIHASDYDTFADALSAASGGVLHVTNDWTITDVVGIAANTTLIIDHCTLTFSNASATGDLQVQGQNVKIYGRGGKINFASVQCIHTGSASNVDGLHVEGLEVTCSTAGNGHGIQINTTGTADNITIRGNRWVDCRHSVLLNDGHLNGQHHRHGEPHQRRLSGWHRGKSPDRWIGKRSHQQ